MRARRSCRPRRVGRRTRGSTGGAAAGAVASAGGSASAGVAASSPAAAAVAAAASASAATSASAASARQRSGTYRGCACRRRPAGSGRRGIGLAPTPRDEEGRERPGQCDQDDDRQQSSRRRPGRIRVQQRRLGAGLGEGVALGAGVETSVTTTWTPVFGLPLVMTGTPAALRHVAASSPTSAVTT